MAEQLFEPRDEEDGYELQFLGTFQDLDEAGWTSKYYYTFLEDREVWIEDDCCITRKSTGGCSDHDYSITMTIIQINDKKKHEFIISGENAHSTSMAISGLFLLASKNKEKVDITFKCFATTPRQPLAPIIMTPDMKSSVASTISIVHLHFVAVDAETCQSLFVSIPNVELRQSTVSGMETIIKFPKQSLNLGCTVAEFSKFAVAAAANPHDDLKQLDLSLHFLLQGESFTNLCSALSNNCLGGLEQLTIGYLDLADEEWSLLFSSLANHVNLKRLTVKFTDNFQDAHRRLTPERRTVRTQAIVKLLETNKNIVEINWPVFQQDETVMEQVTAMLKQNQAKVG